MPSAGELIRCERLKRDRSLSEIASETCISKRYLEAIENDDPGILPGDFFHRSFIRQYARVLGLAETDIRQIVDSLGPPPDIDPLATFNIPQQIAAVEQASRPLAHISTRVCALLFLLVLVGCSGLSAWWNQAQEAADPAMHVAEIVPVAATTTRLIDAAQLDVSLAAREKTWVSLSSDGKTVYSGFLDPSEPKRFAIAQQARLLTANAAGLDLSINGRAVGPLGPRGQARVVLLTQENFQILSPRKM
jgi:hypothetical protein